MAKRRKAQRIAQELGTTVDIVEGADRIGMHPKDVLRWKKVTTVEDYDALRREQREE